VRDANPNVLGSSNYFLLYYEHYFTNRIYAPFLLEFQSDIKNFKKNTLQGATE